MKKVIKNSKSFFLLLILSGSSVFINCENKTETKLNIKQLTDAERKIKIDAERKKWKASPDGIALKKWENSVEGKKVRASHSKIKNEIDGFTNMDAIVISTTFERKNSTASSPKWLLVKIKGEVYMMQFIHREFEKLKSLKVNDKIIVKSRSASYSPNHPYLILSSDYVSKNNKVVFQRDLSKNKGC